MAILDNSKHYKDPHSNKYLTVAAQSNKGPESYPEPEEDYDILGGISE